MNAYQLAWLYVTAQAVGTPLFQGAHNSKNIWLELTYLRKTLFAFSAHWDLPHVASLLLAECLCELRTFKLMRHYQMFLFFSFYTWSFTVSQVLITAGTS